MRGDSSADRCLPGLDQWLMSEVLEGHIRFHLVERRHKHKSRKSNAVDDVIGIAKSYLK